MAYDLTPERVTLDLDGPTVEVYAVASEVIHATAASLGSAWAKADGAASMPALRALYEFFAEEARPTWDLFDHKGPIPSTGLGMCRLKNDLALSIVSAWMDTAVPKTSAVDEVIPEGRLRDNLNRRLKSVKKAA